MVKRTRLTVTSRVQCPPCIFFFVIISEPIPLYYKSNFIWQHKSRGSISSDIWAGKKRSKLEVKRNLISNVLLLYMGVMNIVVYSLVLISFLLDIFPLCRSLDSRMRRMRINRKKKTPRFRYPERKIYSPWRVWNFTANSFIHLRPTGVRN